MQCQGYAASYQQLLVISRQRISAAVECRQPDAKAVPPSQVSMPWSPTRDPGARDLPRLLSQGSLRLRSSLQSQKSLSNMEGASLLRTSSMKVCNGPSSRMHQLKLQAPSRHGHTQQHSPCVGCVRDRPGCLQQVNVLLSGDKEPSETLSRRSAIRARLEDLDANHDGEPFAWVLP